MAIKQIAPPGYLMERQARIREAIRNENIPAMLLTNFADVSYVTGFEGDDSWALVASDRIYLISDFRYVEQIGIECPWVKLVVRKHSLPDELGSILKRHKWDRLGVQGEALTLRQKQTLDNVLKPSKTKLKSTLDVMSKLRNIKDSHELGITEAAIHIAQDGFLAMRAQLRPGMTENEVAGLLGYEMRRRGASNSAFDSIICAGANGSLPHYRPSDVPVQNNMAVLCDWGAIYRGYRSDLTRMLFLGKVPVKVRQIYKVVLDAQQAAIEAIAPGVAAKTVDKKARDIISRAGYKKNFGHGLGHGVGRDIHEPLSLSPKSTAVLAPGMVVTVEPGIYLPGVGGVRIEDDVLVTHDGCRVLSTLPRDMDSAQVM
jgi:Xaa-Pro aminopeptidase